MDVKTLPELAEKSLERLGERMDMVFEDRDYTNLEFLDLARRLQGGLEQIGLKKNDSVVMCMINDPMVIPVFQGIFRCGAIAVPVMFSLTVLELRYIFSDCQTKGIITDEFSLDKVREAARGLDHIKWIVVRSDRHHPEPGIPEYRLETLFESPPQNGFVNASSHDTTLVLYTAGTTGKPKGVVLSHQNLIHTAKASTLSQELHRLKQPRIAINALPLSHVFGVGVMNRSYLTPEHLADSFAVQMTWFDTEQFLSLIQQHQATFIAVVPTMLAKIINHPKVTEYDLSTLTEVDCGAAPLPVEQAQAFAKLAGIDRIREIYGCTECMGLGTANQLSDPYIPGSAGKVYSGMELKIFNKHDEPLLPEIRGEVVLRGPSVMKGYLNRPQETEAALRNEWLHTGDIGYLDADGNLFIVGRKKDMIIRGGENIYPSELEGIIFQHPAVAEAAVVGLPDPVYGERIAAFIVPKHGTKVSEQEIIDLVKAQTCSFKIPSRVILVESIPKSRVGKILKRELRDKEVDKMVT